MSLYREQILDYYANPRNKGRLQSPTFSAVDWNPVCGDKIRLDVKFKQDRVEESRFDGEGCAISLAAASMLTEKIKDMTKKELSYIKEKDIFDMLGIAISPTRQKCALLGWLVLRKGLNLAISQ